MPVPPDVYEALLIEESVAIATNDREAEFESYFVIEPETGETDQVFHAAFINAHLIPGEPSPRLHQSRRWNPDFPRHLPGQLTELAVAHLSDFQPVTHLDHRREIAAAMVEACDEVEAEQSPLAPPFKTLAVLAVSITDKGEPLVYEHISRDFKRALGGHMPEVDFADLESAPDELFRDAYELQREHREGIPPYEEWKRMTIEAANGVVDEPDANEQHAVGYVGQLLLPPDAMQPEFAKLFKE